MQLVLLTVIILLVGRDSEPPSRALDAVLASANGRFCTSELLDACETFLIAGGVDQSRLHTILKLSLSYPKFETQA